MGIEIIKIKPILIKQLIIISEEYCPTINPDDEVNATRSLHIKSITNRLNGDIILLLYLFNVCSP